MERGNTKHSRHLDEELARLLRAETGGSSTGVRLDESLRVEPAGEDQPDPTTLTRRPPPAPPNTAAPTREEIEARSELGRWIARSVLPADRDTLLGSLPDTAPDHVVRQVSLLPAGHTFATVAEMWAALGHVNEARPSPPRPKGARRTPYRGLPEAELPTASVRDTALAAAVVLVPVLARHVGRVMRRLRTRYGRGPLRLRIPGRHIALVLDPADVRRLLAETPHPFAPARRGTSAVLRHLQPHGGLVTLEPGRNDRRGLNEDVLDVDRPVHRLGETIIGTVREETGALMRTAMREGRLTWPEFAAAHARQARRIVLGDAARDDGTATDRGLAALLAGTPYDGTADAAEQGQQWLSAFDAVGIATYRTLGLLVTHPGQAAAARHELGDPALATRLPYLRACVLESVRLWPATTVMLREATAPTRWHGATADPHTTFAVVSSYFQRDGRRLSYADSFEPEVWLDGRADAEPGLVPFGAGPARCPGRDLSLLVASTTLAEMLRYRVALPAGTLRPDALPRTLDHTHLRFRVRAGG